MWGQLSHCVRILILYLGLLPLYVLLWCRIYWLQAYGLLLEYVHSKNLTFQANTA